MGRTACQVDRELFCQCVTKAEERNAFANLSQLYDAVVDLYNLESKSSITKSVAMLRLQEWKIAVKTQKGKVRQKKNSVALSVRKIRSVRMKDFASNEQIQNNFITMKRQLPKRFHGLVNKLHSKADIESAVKLKCLECSSFQPSEIKNCVSYDCSLYAFRPFSRNDETVPMLDDFDSSKDEMEKS